MAFVIKAYTQNNELFLIEKIYVFNRKVKKIGMK